MYNLFIIFFDLDIHLNGYNPRVSPYHSDEGRSYAGAKHMLYNNMSPQLFDYPAGMPLLHVIAYQNFFMPLSLLNNFILLEMEQKKGVNIKLNNNAKRNTKI